MLLIVWTATPRSAQTDASASKSVAYRSSRICTSLSGSSTESNENRSRLRRCILGTVSPCPVTPMKRTSPWFRTSTAASSAPPSRSAVSHSMTSTRLCSCSRSILSTPRRSSERGPLLVRPRDRAAPSWWRGRSSPDAELARARPGAPNRRRTQRCRCGLRCTRAAFPASGPLLLARPSRGPRHRRWCVCSRDGYARTALSRSRPEIVPSNCPVGLE